MPNTRDGSAIYSSHNIHSPLINAESACGTSHTDVAYITSRVSHIRNQVSGTKLAAEDALINAITAIQAAKTADCHAEELLTQTQEKHSRSQYLWDFAFAENSCGFHNPEYAPVFLAGATNLTRQAQMLTAQSANDLQPLANGVYYKQ